MTEAKEFVFEEAAREKLRLGIETLSNLVSVTLGPKGRNIGLATSWGAPSITSDGHHIIKDLELKDQYITMGLQMGQDVATKMKAVCGDGTTTTLVLLNSLVQGGLKLISSGASPILIKRGMDQALVPMKNALDQICQKLQSPEKIQKMAEAASSGDEQIGQLLAQAFEKVGAEGAITIQEGSLVSDELEMVDGMQLDRGYLSPHFCTDRSKMEVSLNHPKVLITDQKIHSIHELIPVLQQLATTGASLLIIADDIDNDALATLVINSLRGILKVAAIKAPSFGDQRKAILEDLAILTGASVITDETGLSLKQIGLEHLGSAQQVVITKDKTILTQTDKTDEAIKKRIKQLEAQIASSAPGYDQEKLQERKAKLRGGVAIIKVGAPSEPEMKKRKQLFQDALSSTKAALEEGIVVGAGMSLVRASLTIKHTLTGDEKLGFDLVMKAARAPSLQIIQNAGFDPLTTLEKLLELPVHHGLNVVTEQIEDFQKSGIFDATKVVKTALGLAISTAGVILLSEVLIGKAPQDSP
jgi:chaperonin GroEL